MIAATSIGISPKKWLTDISYQSWLLLSMGILTCMTDFMEADDDER